MVLIPGSGPLGHLSRWGGALYSTFPLASPPAFRIKHYSLGGDTGGAALSRGSGRPWADPWCIV